MVDKSARRQVDGDATAKSRPAVRSDLSVSTSCTCFANSRRGTSGAALRIDTTNWPFFYPGVREVQLLDGHKVLQVGTRFEANLAGQDVYASVQEFEPITRVAWGDGPKSSKESRAYHAWIITPTPRGAHL